MINESQSDSESTTQIAKAPILGDNIEEQLAEKFRGPNILNKKNMRHCQ